MLGMSKELTPFWCCNEIVGFGLDRTAELNKCIAFNFGTVKTVPYRNTV